MHLHFVYPSKSSANTCVAGRGFGIVPKLMKPEGYFDLDHDSPKEGTMLAQLEMVGDKQRQMAAAKQ
jgi:hypothetical protein